MITATRNGVRANAIRVEGRPAQTSASLSFDNGLERFHVTVGRTDLDSLLEAHLADPAPVVYADGDRVAMEYPLGTRLMRRMEESTVRLDPRILWTIDVHSGAAQSTIDLSNGQLSGISFHGGLAHTELLLPPPQGECLVRLQSVQAVTILRPLDTPVRLQLARGASGVALDHRRYRPASTYLADETEGYAESIGRYLITARSGVSDLTVGVSD